MSPRSVFGVPEFLVEDNSQEEAEEDTFREESCPIDDMVTANLGALLNIYIDLERDIVKMETLCRLYTSAEGDMVPNDDEVNKQQARLARSLRIKDKVRCDILTLERAQLDYWGGFIRPDTYFMALRAFTPW